MALCSWKTRNTAPLNNGSDPPFSLSCIYGVTYALASFRIPQPRSHKLFPTCHFELRCPSHLLGSVLQFARVVPGVALLHLRNPDVRSVDGNGAPPFHSLALLTADSSLAEADSRRIGNGALSATYLIPGHLRLFVRSQIVFDVGTGDHFAVGHLGLLQVPDFAAVALPLVALLHGHRHGHFHAVRRVPEEVTRSNAIRRYSIFAELKFLSIP